VCGASPLCASKKDAIDPRTASSAQPAAASALQPGNSIEKLLLLLLLVLLPPLLRTLRENMATLCATRCRTRGAAIFWCCCVMCAISSTF
jgi:hypothetical protein